MYAQNSFIVAQFNRIHKDLKQQYVTDSLIGEKLSIHEDLKLNRLAFIEKLDVTILFIS